MTATFEARVLDRYPEVRESVLAAARYQQWRSALPVVTIDGETLYVRGGDILRDEDQIIFEWARREGVLTETAIRAAAGGDDTLQSTERRDRP